MTLNTLDYIYLASKWVLKVFIVGHWKFGMLKVQTVVKGAKLIALPAKRWEKHKLNCTFGLTYGCIHCTALVLKLSNLTVIE